MNYTVVLSHVLYDYKVSTEIDSLSKHAAFLHFLNSAHDYTIDEIISSGCSVAGVPKEDVIKLLGFKVHETNS